MSTAEALAHRSLVRRVAAYETSARHQGFHVSSDVWPAFFGFLTNQRLSGLAAAASADGWLRLTAHQEQDLRESRLDEMLLALALERALLRVDDALHAEGVDSVVLKGPAVAHSVYPDPTWRPFTDIDLLVRTCDWRRACAVLERQGYHRKLPEPRRGFDERFGKAAVHGDAQGLQIDLHRRLVVGPFGVWMDPETMFGRTVDFVVAGRRLRRLDDTSLLLHACMHAALGFSTPMLLPIRDVAQIAVRGAVDWEMLAAEARRWRLNSVVAHAFALVRSNLGIPAPRQAEVLLATRPPRRELRALAAYVTPTRDEGAMAWSTLRAVPGIRAKIALARILLLPRRDFLAARSGTVERPSYLRRWATPVRWLLRKG